MGKRKLYQYLLICLMIIGIMSNISGCGDGKKDMPADMEQMADDSTETVIKDVTEDMSETVSGASSETGTADDETTTDGIFRLSSEKYFYLLEGKWRAVEYAGVITDSHCEEMQMEEYWEEKQKYTNEVIEENLGSEYNITRDNLEYFGPFSDLNYVMEDNAELKFNTRFIPGGEGGENISLTPPYLGLSAELTDKGEYYHFIIDAEGTVLIEINYRFFRLERIEE